MAALAFWDLPKSLADNREPGESLTKEEVGEMPDNKSQDEKSKRFHDAAVANKDAGSGEHDCIHILQELQNRLRMNSSPALERRHKREPVAAAGVSHQSSAFDAGRSRRAAGVSARELRGHPRRRLPPRASTCAPAQGTRGAGSTELGARIVVGTLQTVPLGLRVVMAAMTMAQNYGIPVDPPSPEQERALRLDTDFPF